MMIALISAISKRLNHQPGANIVAYFFYQNTSDYLNTAVSVLRGLIYLVIDQEKKLIRHLRNRYDSTGRRLFEDENTFYALQAVLLNILKDQSLGSVYFMIDALDECDPKIHELLRWIIGELSGLSPKIKWLVTSRNEPAFIERLGRGKQLHTSLELNSSHVTRAVANFIDLKIKQLAALKSYSQELQKDIGEVLYEKAEGTFLWVALVCKELEKVRAQKAKLHLRSFPAGLEPLYARMLSIVINQEDKEDAELCLKILCSVTLAFRPLQLKETSQVKEIAFFAQLPRNSSKKQALTDLIDRCGSFITIRQETIYFIHQSAKDYLKGSSIFDSGCGSGESHKHTSTAHLCLDLLSKTLKRNICRMKTPRTSTPEIETAVLNRILPSRVQYACQYWARHIRVGILTDDVVRGVYDFLRIHFLHWLEALSLMRKTSEVISLIGALESIPDVSTTLLHLTIQTDPTKFQTHAALFPFVKDAKRFILEFRYVIDAAPLQLYDSALIFSPEASIIKHVFSSEMPKWIASLPKVARTWTSLLQTLEGHSDRIVAIAFSPDGELFATAEHSTIRLWDPIIGELRGTIEHFSEHTSDGITELAFSPNGELLASAGSCTIRLWDPVTRSLQDTLQIDSFIEAIVFSPNSQLVASIQDYSIEIWDLTTGEPRGTLEISSANISVIAFSPDGQLLAYSGDDTVGLWNPITEEFYGTFGDHTDVLSFSSDSRLLTSVSDHTSIKLWDMTTGELWAMFKGHSDKISAVAFSPNGQLLASASSDMTIKLWDLVTGDLHGTLESHSDRVLKILFAPNSQLLASASHDGTVRLWDPTIKEDSRGLPEGHSKGIAAVAFSPHGQLLASASSDATVRLWDSATGNLQGTLPHSNPVSEILFSPNGQLLASSGFDSPVKLWDIGQRIALPAIEDLNVSNVSFSEDGSRLVVNQTDDQFPSVFGTSPQEQDQTIVDMSYSVSSNRQWVTWKGCDILWLPVNRRPGGFSFKDNTLVLGSGSGQMTFLFFSTNFFPF